MSARYVTLRHAQSGVWVIEAPHPNYPEMPQPHVMPGMVYRGYKTKRDAIKSLNDAGYLVIPNKRDGKFYVYQDSQPAIA
jgi:hypothetical protein